MLKKNYGKKPPKTERQRDEEKEPALKPDGSPFEYVWAMSIIGEECGNPFVSKCPSKKFKARVPCVLSKVNGKIFHFPRCFQYATLTTEELESKKRVRKPTNAKVRDKKISDKRIA